MNQTELIARVRRNVFLPTADPTYTDQVILDELNDGLRAIFADIVTMPRQGWWLKQYSFTSTVAQTEHRINPRAVVGGIEKVEIGDVNGNLWALDEVPENRAQRYEGFGGQTGTPQFYVIRGDVITFLPGFNAAMTVRVSYYIRPSYLVAPQADPLNTGYVNTINLSPTTPNLHVNTFPVYRIARQGISAGNAIATNSVIDIIHPNGTYESPLVETRITNTVSTQIFFAAGTDLSEVQIGDYVRANTETDWPPLPEEFHRVVADKASEKILLQKAQPQKAATFAASAQADLMRLRIMLNTPRTRRQPKRAGARLTTRAGVWNFGPRWRP